MISCKILENLTNFESMRFRRLD